MVYDLLACFLYYTAFLRYLQIRRRGELPGVADVVEKMILVLLAIKAKESAISYPFSILLYELTYSISGSRLGFRWIVREARVGLLSGLLVGVHLGGRQLLHDPLFNYPQYRPVLDGNVFLTNYGVYLKKLFYLSPPPGGRELIVLSLLSLVAALVMKRREMVWGALFTPIATLLLGFSPARNGFAYVIPATGVFVYGASFLTYWIHRLAAMVRSTMPNRPRPRAQAVFVIQASAAVTLLALLVQWHMWAFRFPLPIVHAVQDRNKRLYDDLKSGMRKPHEGARFLFLGDPFQADSYELTFLVRLAFDRQNLQIDRAKTNPQRVAEPAEFRKYDYVFAFHDGRFLLVYRA